MAAKFRTHDYHKLSYPLRAFFNARLPNRLFLNSRLVFIFGHSSPINSIILYCPVSERFITHKGAICPFLYIILLFAVRVKSFFSEFTKKNKTPQRSTRICPTLPRVRLCMPFLVLAYMEYSPPPKRLPGRPRFYVTCKLFFCFVKILWHILVSGD